MLCWKKFDSKDPRISFSFFNNLSRFRSRTRSFSHDQFLTRGYWEYPRCKKSWRGKKEIWYIINIWTTCPVFLEKHIRLEFDSKRRFLAHCVFPSTPQKPPVQFKYRFRCNFTLGTIMARQLWDVTQYSRYRESRYAIWRDTKFFIAALIPTVQKKKKIAVSYLFSGKLCIRNFTATVSTHRLRISLKLFSRALK